MNMVLSVGVSEYLPDLKTEVEKLCSEIYDRHRINFELRPSEVDILDLKIRFNEIETPIITNDNWKIVFEKKERIGNRLYLKEGFGVKDFLSLILGKGRVILDHIRYDVTQYWEKLQDIERLILYEFFKEKGDEEDILLREVKISFDKRVDAIWIHFNEHSVIEVKRVFAGYEGFNAIGQVLYYKALYEEENPDLIKFNIKPIILCTNTEYELKRVCEEKLDIDIYVLPIVKIKKFTCFEQKGWKEKIFY